jgi:enamine deaminase RidA (YjgF/YER057c/UK114 family)
MASKIDAKLAELNITLPNVAAPVAKYVPFVQSNNHIIISGQIARRDDGGLFIGKLGDNVTDEDGAIAARSCGLQIISILKQACGGDLDKVKKCVKLSGYVNATPDYKNHPQVVNGASNLMVEVFGEEIGMHARAAVGMSSLPLGVAVEVDAIFEIA